MSDLKTTQLHAKHIALGAKLVPFAGYDMPVQYLLGVLKEHLHTREKCGLFDVSHMGQCFISADDGTYATAAKALEALVPASLQDLEPGQQRYSQFLNEDGGILDDLMISRLGLEGYDHTLYLVVNAGCKPKTMPISLNTFQRVSQCLSKMTAYLSSPCKALRPLTFWVR